MSPGLEAGQCIFEGAARSVLPNTRICFPELSWGDVRLHVPISSSQEGKSFCFIRKWMFSATAVQGGQVDSGRCCENVVHAEPTRCLLFGKLVSGRIRGVCVGVRALGLIRGREEEVLKTPWPGEPSTAVSHRPPPAKARPGDGSGASDCTQAEGSGGQLCWRKGGRRPKASPPGCGDPVGTEQAAWGAAQLTSVGRPRGLSAQKPAGSLPSSGDRAFYSKGLFEAHC